MPTEIVPVTQPSLTIVRPTLTVGLTPTASPTALVFPTKDWMGRPLLDRLVADKPGIFGQKWFYGLVFIVYLALVVLLFKQVLRIRS